MYDVLEVLRAQHTISVATMSLLNTIFLGGGSGVLVVLNIYSCLIFESLVRVLFFILLTKVN